MKQGNLTIKELAGSQRLFDFQTLHSLLEFVTTYLLELSRMQRGITVCFERPALGSACVAKKISREDLDSPAYESIRDSINQAAASRKLIYQPRCRTKHPGSAQVTSFICTPFATNHEVFGFFYGERHDSAKPLTRHELALIQNFVLQATLGIENRILHDSNVKDPMLGIYNLDYFKKRLAEELQRGLRYKKPIAVMMADIDDFDRINSVLDHTRGDLVLQEVSAAIKASIRATDILARFGGDRFAILLPETDHAAAQLAAERMKTRVEAKAFGSGDRKINLTIGVGLVSSSLAPPTTAEAIINEVENALTVAKERGRGQIASLQKEPDACGRAPVLIGECPSIKNILSMVGRLGSVDATILITGETGTGKEVVAKMIHHNSTRRDKPFVVVNCGAIPENLIESELFGHERGSFTGAYTTQKGKFELAHGGSILLDEIGELPLHLQPKILRAVEERQVQRIGGKSPIPLNVRILAATNKDLEATVREGRFRQDLFYRLNVISIHIPALRNRDRDALILAHYFVRQYAAGYAKPVKQFTPDAESLILKYHWPGNVRELAHLIERAVIMDQDGTICPKDLDLKPIFTRPQRLKDITGEAEKDAVLNALVRNRGNISRASRELDISRVTFKNMIRKYGFKPHDYRGG